MKWKVHIPNALSLLRMVCGLFVLFVPSSDFLRFFFIIGVVSDALDGYLARLLGSCSKIGAMLDPLCDRVFFYSFCLRLLWNNSDEQFMHILLMPIRDIAIGIYWCIWWLHRKKNVSLKRPPLQSLVSGKILTIFQSFLLAMILWGHVVDVKWMYPHFFLIAVTVSELVT